ncbi:MAG TPA: SDR family NAD(P)-dependent oxidoreductase [Deltaproteobacteria bacterium]|nr:SDR family NAD(P)-dependent oxidoreductase [Deltaproteobacteria bacterium]
MSRVLVTGAAGFIGYHLAERLVADGHRVVGIDDLNPSYDPALKEARLARLARLDRIHLVRGDLTDRDTISSLLRRPFERVFHLAAHAGVRRSIEDPRSYVSANLAGTTELLRALARTGVEHLIYASSSSVYGLGGGAASHEKLPTAHPTSPYAATKIAAEAMIHAFSHLHALPATGLRLFTVYGPWGRPDMALFRFTEAIVAGRPLPVFNHGRMSRDFTYIDDAVEAIVRIAERPPSPGPDRVLDAGSSTAPHRVINVGSGRPVPLSVFIDAIEAALGIPAERELLPMQPGDVLSTCADPSRLEALTGFVPRTPVVEGVERFVRWYLEHHPPPGSEPALVPGG